VKTDTLVYLPDSERLPSLFIGGTMKKKKIDPNKPFIAIMSLGNLQKSLEECNKRLKELLTSLDKKTGPKAK